MQTAISKVTSKYQATIPKSVREILHINSGDSIAFDINDQTIQLRKAVAVDLVFTSALEETLDEWNSAKDEEAYGEL